MSIFNRKNPFLAKQNETYREQHTKAQMVNCVVVSSNGTISDVAVPPKTPDVLEWCRKKYKNQEIQFQGKIQDPIKETHYFSIFSCTTGEKDQLNNHILPPPFNEEQYTGQIVILATESQEEENFETNISSYVHCNSSPMYYDPKFRFVTFKVSV